MQMFSLILPIVIAVRTASAAVEYTSDRAIVYAYSDVSHPAIRDRLEWYKRNTQDSLIVDYIDVRKLSVAERFANDIRSVPSIFHKTKNGATELFPASNPGKLLPWLSTFTQDTIPVDSDVRLKELISLEPNLVAFSSKDAWPPNCHVESVLCIRRNEVPIGSVVTYSAGKPVMEDRAAYISNKRIAEWTFDGAEVCYTVGRPALMLFGHDIDEMKKVAAVKVPREYVIFASNGASQPDTRLLKLFGLDAGDYALVLTFAKENIRGNDSRYAIDKKYVLRSPTPDSLVEFTQKILKNEATPFWLSELPIDEEDNRGPVRYLVGSTFYEEIINRKADLVVDFFAPWCGHCRLFNPIYEQVAQAFSQAGVNHIKFSRIDASGNDTYGITLSGYPTIAVYPVDSGAEAKILKVPPHDARDLVEAIATVSSTTFDVQAVMKELGNLQPLDLPSLSGEL